MIPFNQLPHVLNPPEGFVATANNRVTPSGYPYRISNMWEPPSRVQRIRERLTAKDKLSELDFENIQLDVLSPFAREITTRVLTILEKQNARSSDLETAYRYLKGWNFEMRGESAAAAIFQVFLTRLLRNTFHDELGDTLYKAFLEFGGFPLRDLQRFLTGGSQRWFDDVTTKTVRETRNDQVLKSLTQAVSELRQKFGDKPAKWRWDRLHTMTFRHLLGGQAMLSKIFNIGPLPLGGGMTTVNNARYQLNKPYACWVGPSMRMIVNFSDLSRMKMILPPGEVEHPLSPHFRDQADMWVSGLYLECLSDVQQVQEEGKALLLQPVGSAR
jgi:penicillin amidase